MSSGVYASLVAQPIVPMGERWDVGTRVGMAFTLLALGALAGPPISGAINVATGGYTAVGFYAGTSHLREAYRLTFTLPLQAAQWKQAWSCC